MYGHNALIQIISRQNPSVVNSKSTKQLQCQANCAISLLCDWTHDHVSQIRAGVRFKHFLPAANWCRWSPF